MSEFYPLIFGLIFIGILGFDAWLFLRFLNRAWWSYRWVRLTTYLIPLLGGLCIILWAWGIKLDSPILIGIGASVSAFTIVIQIALLLSLPVSGAIHIVIDIFRKITKKMITAPVKPDPKRRLILKTTTVIFPVIAVSTGVSGVACSFGESRIPKINLSYNDLPSGLNGLKILQISDSHLGYYISLNHLEQMLIKAEEQKPDIILLTGDIADDLRILPDALSMISQVNPHLGCYACLGNHEYYRGINEVLRAYNASPIPLLVNAGIAIDIEGIPLYIAGADDPRWMRRDNSRFIDEAVDKSIALAPDNAFKILMSHRPTAFDLAAEKGVQLTLAGHTHGGQIGVGGRSIFEYLLPLKYQWGHYKNKNGSQLYTTSGFGHWFPFRLGCPSETPLIELRKS